MRLPVESPVDIMRIFTEHHKEKLLRTALYRAGFNSAFPSQVRRTGNMYLESALRLMESIGLMFRVNGHTVRTKADAVEILEKYRTEPRHSLSKRVGYDENHFSKCIKSGSIRLFTLLTYAKAMGLEVYVWKRWTRERRTRHIQELADEGLSAARIADQLGTTRNAVIGHASRYDIKLTGKPGKMIRAPLMEASPNDPPLAGSTPTSLLKTTGCRWPVEGGFCNCEIHAKLYCKAHHKRAYRPALPVHPLLMLLATKGPQTPATYHEASKYNGLVSERLVMFRKNANGLSTFYLTDAGRAKTPPV